MPKDVTPQTKILSVARIKNFPYSEWVGETLEENYFVLRYSTKEGLWLGMSKRGTVGASLDMRKLAEAKPGYEPTFEDLAKHLKWILPHNYQELDS